MTIRVDVPVGEWVDVYSTAGLTDGVAMVIQNLGTNQIWITESATEPTTAFGSILTKIGTDYSQATVGAASDKIWLMSKDYASVVAVED